jgi:hypothetical protein
MKCPFWQRLEYRVEPKFDAAGQKVGEEKVYELAHENCQRAECEIFDATNQQCAFLSLNRNTSLILENLSQSLPVRLKGDFDTALYEKAEMLSVVFSTGLTHLQEAMKGYSTEIGRAGEAILNQLNAIGDGLRGISAQLEPLAELKRPSHYPPETSAGAQASETSPFEPNKEV